ncbi:hypothetical protein HNO89_000315 [Sporosarcina luteola]|nr:hypothetical protein [Sporosarcina luteola]
MKESLLFKTIQGLKKRAESNCEFIIQARAGNLIPVLCMFNHAANPKKIKSLEASGLKIPPDFREFLLLHDGATLFSHLEYGGGITLLDIEGILNLYEEYQEYLPEGWYPIGFDNEDLLLIDSKKVKTNSKAANYLYWSSLIDLAHNDVIDLKGNFEIWLDRLFMAQGNKYWEWNIYSAETYYITHE